MYCIYTYCTTTGGAATAEAAMCSGLGAGCVARAPSGAAIVCGAGAESGDVTSWTVTAFTRAPSGAATVCGAGAETPESDVGAAHR